VNFFKLQYFYSTHLYNIVLDDWIVSTSQCTYCDVHGLNQVQNRVCCAYVQVTPHFSCLLPATFLGYCRSLGPASGPFILTCILFSIKSFPFSLIFTRHGILPQMWRYCYRDALQVRRHVRWYVVGSALRSVYLDQPTLQPL
jgi:hypothetical protein